MQTLAEDADEMPVEQRTAVARRLSEIIEDSEASLPVRIQAIKTTAALAAPSSIESLETALRDSDAELRSEVCRALGAIASDRATQTLGQVMATDPSSDVRLAAVRALGNHRSPTAIQALSQVLDDSDPAVQYVAMKSLSRATGTDLGLDVRKWKQATQDPGLILAGQDAPSRR